MAPAASCNLESADDNDGLDETNDEPEANHHVIDDTDFHRHCCRAVNRSHENNQTKPGCMPARNPAHLIMLSNPFPINWRRQAHVPQHSMPLHLRRCQQQALQIATNGAFHTSTHVHLFCIGRAHINNTMAGAMLDYWPAVGKTNKAPFAKPMKTKMPWSYHRLLCCCEKMQQTTPLQDSAATIVLMVLPCCIRPPEK